MRILSTNTKPVAVFLCTLGFLTAPSLAYANEQSSSAQQTNKTHIVQPQKQGAYRTHSSIKTKPSSTRRIVEPVPVVRSLGYSQVASRPGTVTLHGDPIQYNMPVFSRNEQNIRKSMPILLDKSAFTAR